MLNVGLDLHASGSALDLGVPTHVRREIGSSQIHFGRPLVAIVDGFRAA